jgi:hypothetical protein
MATLFIYCRMPVLHMTVLALTLSVTLLQAEERKTWIYEKSGGGYFEKTGEKEWTEYTTDSTYTFREITRTEDYIQLYDASRKMSIRLYSDRALMAFPGSGGWLDHSTGAWK